VKADRLGIEPATCKSQVQRPAAVAIKDVGLIDFCRRITFLMSRRLICGGEVDTSPATLDPARGLIHDPAARDGLAAATAAASMRRRDVTLGGDWNTSSSSIDATSAGSTSCVARLPQLLC